MGGGEASFAVRFTEPNVTGANPEARICCKASDEGGTDVDAGGLAAIAGGDAGFAGAEGAA